MCVCGRSTILTLFYCQLKLSGHSTSVRFYFAFSGHFECYGILRQVARPSAAVHDAVDHPNTFVSRFQLLRRDFLTSKCPNVLQCRHEVRHPAVRQEDSPADTAARKTKI